MSDKYFYAETYVQPVFLLFLNESEESNPSEYPQTNSGLLDPVLLNEDNHLVFCTKGTSFISGS